MLLEERGLSLESCLAICHLTISCLYTSCLLKKCKVVLTQIKIKKTSQKKCFIGIIKVLIVLNLMTT